MIELGPRNSYHEPPSKGSTVGASKLFTERVLLKRSKAMMLGFRQVRIPAATSAITDAQAARPVLGVSLAGFDGASLLGEGERLPGPPAGGPIRTDILPPSADAGSWRSELGPLGWTNLPKTGRRLLSSGRNSPRQAAFHSGLATEHKLNRQVGTLSFPTYAGLSNAS